MKTRLKILSDLLTEAHTEIQQSYNNLDPVIGVRQNLRQSGFPADLVSIDCLRSKKRIILLLNDNEPDTLGYQLSMMDVDPEMEFTDIPFTQVDKKQLFDWMKDYFLNDSSTTTTQQ